jgi:hypothetical protein
MRRLVNDGRSRRVHSIPAARRKTAARPQVAASAQMKCVVTAAEFALTNRQIDSEMQTATIVSAVEPRNGNRRNATTSFRIGFRIVTWVIKDEKD